jgi:Fe-S-cluster-containing hydrogenase component 2
MTVNPVLCQGCGSCAMTCPSGAINVHQFTFDQTIAQVDALLDWQIPSSKQNKENVLASESIEP